MNTTIGYVKDNGDLVVLATLNNDSSILTKDKFDYLVSYLTTYLTDGTDRVIVSLPTIPRRDAPNNANDWLEGVKNESLCCINQWRLFEDSRGE